MYFHQEYLKTLNLKQIVPLCSKPVRWNTERWQEAQRLSKSMSGQRPFSFIRLGDMDLTLLLAAQDGLNGEAEVEDGPVRGTDAYGNPGIGLQYAERFMKAFRCASYVDFHELLWVNEKLLPRLRIQRSPTLLKNPTRETSYILPAWLEIEFKEYCHGRRIGFAGAESGILEILSQQDEYQKIAKDYWPSSGEVYFHTVRNYGRNLDQNLDLIKADLCQFIQQNKIDTLFLALGGGAKILCYELAEELNICAFDCGTMLRALTYSGSDGNRAARSSHSLFLFRVPFSLYMDALEEAIPDMEPEVFLAKAHAQLILEVQRKEMGWTHAARDYDLSDQNKSCFLESWKIYKKRYSKLFNENKRTEKERKDFLHFCGKNRLTLDGIVFYSIFILKSAFKVLVEGLIKRR